MPTSDFLVTYSFIHSLSFPSRVSDPVVLEVVVVVVLVGYVSFGCIVLPHIFQFFYFLWSVFALQSHSCRSVPSWGPPSDTRARATPALPGPALAVLGLCLVLVLVLVFCGWFRFGIKFGVRGVSPGWLSALLCPGFSLLAFLIALLDGPSACVGRTKYSSKSTNPQSRREGLL